MKLANGDAFKLLRILNLNKEKHQKENIKIKTKTKTMHLRNTIAHKHWVEVSMCVCPE